MPPIPQLPEFRLSDDFAFSRIAVDFAGPICVKDVYNKSSGMNKAYIMLYTSASSRAVHLDLDPNMPTQAFVRSFKRFTARRDVPRLVVSDNVLIYYLLFNRFHHDYSAKIRLGKNTFEQVTRTRDEGAGHTTERGSKLRVPLKKYTNTNYVNIKTL